MILKKFYLKCLSHGSYFLADEKSREAAIIDPQRDVDQYLEILKKEKFTLKFILETHVHADFISGHWDLANETGAQVVFGVNTLAKRPFRKVKDGDELMLGTSVSIRVLETPGHTPESVCYLAQNLEDPTSIPALFSGDTLFVGDVGRPDLLGSKMPAEELASMLYDTLENKIKTLSDETRVYPAHGAGSACGKKIGDAEFTTIGAEKLTNDAMQATNRKDFIKLVTSDLPIAPGYFSEDVRLNLEGMGSLSESIKKIPALTPEAVEAGMANGAIVLDTRGAEPFAAGSIAGAVNIGLEGQFAPWLGTLFPSTTSFILLTEEGLEEESAIHCGRIGYENILGFVKEGVSAWLTSGRKLVCTRRLEPSEMTSPKTENSIILDVRNPGETDLGVIPGAVLIPLNRLLDDVNTIDKQRPIQVYCASGYRSSIALSLLRRIGYKEVNDLAGGMLAYRKSGLPIEAKLSAKITTVQ